MALVTQAPNQIALAYDPLWYYSTYDYANETDFKYLYDIYTKDGLLISKKVFPFPSYAGKIDASPFVKDLLSFDLNCTKTGITSTTNSIIQYDTYIGYSGSNHNLEPVSTGVRYAFNGIDDNFNYNNYILSSTTSKFLTYAPTGQTVFMSDYYTLSFLNGDFSGVTSSIKYIYLVTGGSEGKMYRMTNPHFNYIPSSLESVDQLYKTVGVGVPQINNTILYNVTNNKWTTGATIITSTTPYYEIYAASDTGAQRSVKYRFTINHDTPRYSKNQVCWLNRLGNFSYYTFTMKVVEKTSSERSTFEKNRYGLNGGVYGTRKQDRGTKVFNNNITKEFTYATYYINQETFDHLEELFTSPEVYIISNGEYTPIIITDKDFVNRKIVNDKMISTSITFELANKKITNT